MISQLKRTQVHENPQSCQPQAPHAQKTVESGKIFWKNVEFPEASSIQVFIPKRKKNFPYERLPDGCWCQPQFCGDHPYSGMLMT